MSTPPLFPPRPIVLRLVRTSAVMWLVARVAVGALGVVMILPPITAVFAAGVLGLVWFDIRTTGERLLYADLAISPLVISAVVLLVVGCLEIVAGLALLVVVPNAPVETWF